METTLLEGFGISLGVCGIFTYKADDPNANIIYVYDIELH